MQGQLEAQPAAGSHGSPLAASSECKPGQDSLAVSSWVFHGPNAVVCFVKSDAPQGRRDLFLKSLRGKIG